MVVFFLFSLRFYFYVTRVVTSCALATALARWLYSYAVVAERSGVACLGPLPRRKTPPLDLCVLYMYTALSFSYKML